MDSTPPISSFAPAPVRPFARLAPWALALGLIFYAWLLARHSGAYAGGADSSGYLNHARLLAAGQVKVPPRPLPQLAPEHTPPYLLVPLGFKPAPDPRHLVPTYPTGLPLLLAAVAPVTGWELAPHVLAVLHGVLGVLLAYLAARAFGLSCRWGWVAAIIVGGSPLYLNMALQTLSDVPALVWTTAAVLAAWHSVQSDRRWALAAGFAFALAVLVRPTNLLALVPIACALGFDWRRWALFVVAGAPGGAFFLLHTHAAYGKYLTTGYGDSAGLEWALVPRTLAHYVRWLPVLFTPVVIGIFALPWLGRTARRAALVLGAWLLVFAGFYSAYYNTHETWWYLRFLLPAIVAAVVGGLLGFRAVLARVMTPLRARIAWLLALVFAVGNGWHFSTQLHAFGPGDGEKIYPLTAQWLRERLPANAVVAVMQHSGAVYYYTDFTIVRWDQMTAEEFVHVRAAIQASGRPLYAALFPFEVEEQKALAERMPGRWTEIGSVRDTRIWQFDFSTPSAP